MLTTLLNNIFAAAEFEIGRSLTLRRVVVSVFLACFPGMMMSLVLLASRGQLGEFNFVTSLFVYIVGILSLLLWATPNVYSELESKGWVYLTGRSTGRISILLGKYLAACGTSWAIAASATLICLFIAESSGSLPGNFLRLLAVYLGVITLAVLSYGAIFSLIGTISQKRSMVIAAVYMLVSEIVIATVPDSAISRLSPRFYLVGLMYDWAELRLPFVDNADLELLIGDYSAGVRVLALLAISALTLAAGCWAIRYNEYITADEA